MSERPALALLPALLPALLLALLLAQRRDLALRAVGLMPSWPPQQPCASLDPNP